MNALSHFATLLRTQSVGSLTRGNVSLLRKRLVDGLSLLSARNQNLGDEGSLSNEDELELRKLILPLLSKLNLSSNITLESELSLDLLLELLTKLHDDDLLELLGALRLDSSFLLQSPLPTSSQLIER